MPRWLLQTPNGHRRSLGAGGETEVCALCRSLARAWVRAGGVLRSGEARAWEGTFARSASWSEALEAAGFLVAVGFFAAGIELRSVLWLARCE